METVPSPLHKLYKRMERGEEKLGIAHQAKTEVCNNHILTDFNCELRTQPQVPLSEEYGERRIFVEARL